MFPKCPLALWLLLTLLTVSEQGALPVTTHAPPLITPSVSRYTNHTADVCALSCSSHIGPLTINYWTALSIATTITAETVVTIINKKKDSTRVTTITNEEVDFSKYPKPTNLNSDGTQTHVITDVDERGSGSTTITLTFPSIYVQYNSAYQLSGQIPTTINGQSTCTSISKDGGVPISWPSHPPLPLTTGTVDPKLLHQDPKGWTFFPMQGADTNPGMRDILDDSADYSIIKSFFPDLPMWSCQGLASEVGNGPNDFSSTALFLTDTSTSIEDDDDAAAVTADPPKTSVMVDAVSAQPTPSAKVEPSKTPLPPAPASIAKPPVPSQTPGTSTGPEPSSSEGENTPSKPQDGSGAEQQRKTVSSAVPAQSSTPSDPGRQSSALTGESAGTDDQKGTKEGGAVEQHGVPEQNHGAALNVDDGNSDGRTNPTANGDMATATGRATETNAPVDAIQSHPVSGEQALNAAAVNVPSMRVILGGQTFTPVSASQYVVAGHTIAPGSQPTMIGNGNSAIPIGLKTSNGNIFFSVGSSETVIPMNAKAAAAAQSSAPGISPAVTSNAQGQYLIGEQTLSPGMVNTVAGTLISLAPSGASIAVLGSENPEAAQAAGGSHTLDSKTPAATSPVPVLTFGKQTIAPDEKSQYIVAGQTLSPGGAITVSGSRISLEAGGSKAIVGESITQDILGPTRPMPTPTAAFMFGTNTIAPDAQARYTVNGQTLSPGSAITDASGAVFSLKPDGSEAVEIAGGSSVTQTLANIPGPTSSSSSSRNALIFGAQTIAPNSLGQYIVDGQTLTAGAAITVSGTPISLDSNGAMAVVGTKTESVGGAIISGLSGGVGSSGNGSGGSQTGRPIPFTGDASTFRTVSMAMAVAYALTGVLVVVNIL